MSQVLFRFDDASPYMVRSHWDRIEQLLNQYGIRPLVAIIPDCQDPGQQFQSYDKGFWERARQWQKNGWVIALHGETHVLSPDDGGLLEINDYSEFVGLSLETQAQKLQRGYEILCSKGLRPRVWIAPAHGFDRNTIEALKQATPIRHISDGLTLRPFRRYGMNWVPQLVGRPVAVPFGVMTTCLHPNTMSEKHFSYLESWLTTYRDRVVDASTMFNWTYPAFGLGHRAQQCLIGRLLQVKRAFV